MSGQDFSDPMGPATVETPVMSQAQIRLDHAVEWIAEHNAAEVCEGIDLRTATPTITFRSTADLYRLLRGTGAECQVTGLTAITRHDGLRFMATDSEHSQQPRKVTL